MNELRTLNDRVAHHEENVAGVEQQAASLSSKWSDVRQSYAAAQEALRRAETHYLSALKLRVVEERDLSAARAVLKVAKQRWKVAQLLIIAAAAVDAANMDAQATHGGDARIDPRSCSEGMSTASFRRVLLQQGVNLVGMDVDHIVPRSLGGADHPLNYQVISAQENRSLGATWNRAKCLSAGSARCVDSVAVSRVCGSYGGSVPEI